MKKNFKKSLSNLAYSGILFCFSLCIFGLNPISAQQQPNSYSISSASQQQEVDPSDFVGFRTEVRNEIQSVRQDDNLSKLEKEVRVNLLEIAVNNVGRGFSISNAFQESFYTVQEKFDGRAPQINIKRIALTYKNQFS